uniref:Uncharacterized protein n=1 Tax=Colacium vesiculosum TaxID=102910 RepID=I6NIR5_9EUGL|nr:hypothetical protein [Colacium vesiculosum]
MYAVIIRRLGNNFYKDKAYLLEACLAQMTLHAFPDECPSLLTSDNFISGVEEIMFLIWKQVSSLSQTVLFKSDQVNNAILYVYTNDNPTYLKLTEVQALRFVKKLISALFFNNVPEGFNNRNFF